MFVRRKGYSADDAKDLTQAFFARLLEKHSLERVLAGNGRLRAFLLTALTHLLADQWHRSRALKRGGGADHVSFEADLLEERYAVEPTSQNSPEQHFDQLWADALLHRALGTLEGEFRAAGKATQFDALAGFLSRLPEDREYAAVGDRLWMGSHAVATAVFRLRRRYRFLIRQEIAHTVSDAADLEAELHYLIELARRSEEPARPAGPRVPT